jgi:hypothetical protein
MLKLLWAHALRSLIIARKKLVGQRVTLENQMRLAVVFGVRLPRALTTAFIDQALKLKDWPSASRGDRPCAKRASLWRVVSRSSCMRCCATEPSSHRLRWLGSQAYRTGGRIELPQGATPEAGSRRRRGLCCSGRYLVDCAFNLAALRPAYPIRLARDLREDGEKP